MQMSGYPHPAYAASFSEFGIPLSLPNSGGWLVVRNIRDSGLQDAMGCYPLFCCLNWEGLQCDIEMLKERLISVVLVADPLGSYSYESLSACFDKIIRFKEHFVIETGRPPSSFVSSSHRKHALRALREVEVEICPEPLEYLEDWEKLFRVLVDRRSITGLKRLSRACFKRQFAIPGLIMFRAVHSGETIGFDLWYLQDDCAQAHLAAFSPLAYRLRASYATKWCAIDYLKDRVKWINLGAGHSIDGSDGLSQFKQGWANSKKTAWLCCSVLREEIYTQLSSGYGSTTNYFPAYRDGEF